jgi:hypothetical protein
VVRERREGVDMREYPEANIREFHEIVILSEDDESWYSQAGLCMVERVVNLFNDEWSNEELHRIDETLNLLKIQFSQAFINGHCQSPEN